MFSPVPVPIPPEVLALDPFAIGVYVLRQTGHTRSETVTRCERLGASRALCAQQVDTAETRAGEAQTSEPLLLNS